MLADLLWFAHDRNPQCEPQLYFPVIPPLQQLTLSHPGRVLGIRCLPADVPYFCGLHDVRGYDGLDPARMIDLMRIAGKLGATTYALTQSFVPTVAIAPDGTILLSRVLDMLNVTHVILPGAPSSKVKPEFVGSGYFVVENRNALSRIFIPRRVEVAEEAEGRLVRLSAPDFNPNEVAYVESPIDFKAPSKGTATILEETPTYVRVSAQMTSPGLVVLADLWDKGWRAYLDRRRVPILRTNHALRGVVTQSGTHVIEFRYSPIGFGLGLILWGFAACTLVGLATFGLLARKRGRSHILLHGRNETIRSQGIQKVPGSV
jgi:hypothetical protein